MKQIIVGSYSIVYLGVSKFILVMRHINRPKQLLRSLLVVHELSLRACTGIQYFVPIAKQLSVTFGTLFSKFGKVCGKLSNTSA